MFDIWANIEDDRGACKRRVSGAAVVGRSPGSVRKICRAPEPLPLNLALDS